MAFDDGKLPDLAETKVQGYLNIIGMFYADRLVYIFESSPTEGVPELLSIPKLPIRLDTEALHTHAPTLALLSAGAAFRREEIATIPEALLRVNVNGEATFSEWGDLVWNRMRQDILAGPLLTFPYLQYEPSFRKDFEKATRSQRIAVQDTLAEASAFLLLEEGDLQVLRAHGGLQYDNYTSQRTDNKPPIGHFRMAGGDRVSCTAESGSLRLRHFGVHDYVNERP